jgi:hypothetical protein
MPATAAHKGLSGITADHHKAFIKAAFAIQPAPSSYQDSPGTAFLLRLLHQRCGTVQKSTGQTKIIFFQISENKGAFRI